MNTIFDDLAGAMKTSNTTWDDIAVGLACATLCAATASMFVVMFAGVV